MRLFFGLSSTSACFSTFNTGGTYMPKRPRRPFFSPYQPPTGLSGAAPRFNGPLGGGLLLVRASQEHPITVGLEHRVQVGEAAEVVSQLGLSHLDNQGRRVECFVAKRHELRLPLGVFKTQGCSRVPAPSA